MFASRRMPILFALAILIALGLKVGAQAPAATPSQAPLLPADLRTRIDDAARRVLEDTGVPSASVAVVKDGQVAYVQAYGNARLQPQVPASPAMRYGIGSISKQFTAAAILRAQEQGKLSLDDKVARFVPDVTRANDVSVRQLLSHTSGYQDYWPQDYVPPFMMQPITLQKILDLWARKPLDFEPGTKWQYSNTNYVIAGLIIEKITGGPFPQFLKAQILDPLGLKSAINVDEGTLGPGDPSGYMRYGLGPLRPAPKEGKGWLFAMGELAMTAEDLAKWDASVINRTLLKPASYDQFEREVVLVNGLGTRYGLGVDVTNDSGRRMLGHGGEISGYTAQNMIFPDDRVAVAVLTNQDAVSASGTIARQIAQLVFASDDAAMATKLAQARKIFDGLQRGTIDRSLFTANANTYFSDEALRDFGAGLAPLGTPQRFVQVSQGLRGGMTLRAYSVTFPKQALRVWTYEMPDGKLEQYQIAPQ